MKEFPDSITPENKEKFSYYRQKRITAYLRKEIMELILMGDENSYFDLDSFSRKYVVNKKDFDSMVECVSKELVDLGWNVKLSFGGTGLFVYSTETPPPSCYEDEL